MRKPGIEPGSQPWQGRILPLNYFRFFLINHSNLKDYSSQALYALFS